MFDTRYVFSISEFVTLTFSNIFSRDPVNSTRILLSAHLSYWQIRNASAATITDKKTFELTYGRTDRRMDGQTDGWMQHELK